MPPGKPEGSSVLDDYVNHLIDKKLDDHDTSIKTEDAKEIVEHLMPELEKVVSKIIIKHFRVVAHYILKELKEEE